MTAYRFLVVDGDGHRIGSLESDRLDWQPEEVFELDGLRLRLVEILPEVSTMVAYNAVFVAEPV